uniref:Protein CLP1 homolog n=1 Tax=Oryza punctata TaxID=4537 RepID=A0A0E0JXC3_ORYPU
MAAAGGAAQPPRQYKLAPQSELRVEVPPDAPVRVRLVAGTAEVFGTELPPEGWVPVPPRSKIAIFTWHGATVELDGVSESEYTSDETPMVVYVNTHAILDARRARARAATAQGAPPEASQGPRVIIVGPSDSGKSTLCKMLLSWAAKQGWKPTYVDLDIGQGSITIPGCISATPIEKPIDIVDGIPLEMPLAYFYGHPSPSVSPDVYRALMKELAQTLDKQFSGNSESRAAGMIINTMGWVENLGLELLHNSIEIFKANEKLWKMLKDAAKNKPNIDVVKLHKSEGVVPRNPKYRQKTRSFRIKEYFYGIANDLAPHSNPVADPTRLVAVNISTDMVHTVLAVSYAKEPDEIVSSNVAGFIHVTDVDIQRKKLTYIAPCPGDLPSKLLIASSLTWYEA